MQTVIEQGQNIADVCIQCYGSLEYLFELIKENNWQGLNTNLAHGDEVTYRQLSSLEEGFEIQTFYHNREIRVRTGEELFVPSSSCGLPEGYMMGQFTIESIGNRHILWLDINGILTPPTDPNIYGSASQSYFALINSPNLQPQQAAMLFAEWITVSYWHTQGLYAVATGNTVRLYVPTTFCDCGGTFRIHAYGQRTFFNPNEETEWFTSTVDTQPAILYYDNYEYGTLWCCSNMNDLQSDSNFISNAWLITN